MIKYIKRHKNPKVLIITPLRIEDKISKSTLNTIKCKYPYVWISYSGNNNIPQNTQNALNEYLEKNKIPKYIIKIDNDIMASKNMLDSMVDILDNSCYNVAYSYCSFSYVGKQRLFFPSIKFNKEKLLKSNYISSNSMFKTKILLNNGGFITDSKYERLLDYCLYLKLLQNGFVGEPSNGYFDAKMSNDSVSNRGIKDYKLKFSRVKEDFINPILKEIK